ncbi:ABC transporter permease subunit [Roseomonas sp. GC11]|uniref:ABC transporter permease n=1 Tax=Roseomonas sp. GC11 TaxID=2950546 RepID=UPI0021093D4F|nr:ABC transporter permease subunit [Roseomonas sp. GC11]MCQ4161992.1 ABC transporter permease subunit [Roseomonas sp. GC11]
MKAVAAQALAFLAALAAMPHSAPLWAALFPEVQRPLWESRGWFALLGWHLALALGAAALAALLGLGAAILATRGAGRRLRPVLDALFALAQAVPPVAVIALALPLLGFGAAPVLLALVLYAALPVLRAATAGLEAVPAPVRDAARGCGMGPLGMLWRVELPIALPVIRAGLRMAVVMAIATTAVGAIAGAECLGTPIVTGLANGNTAWVAQGALFTAWLALIAHRALRG